MKKNRNIFFKIINFFLLMIFTIILFLGTIFSLSNESVQAEFNYSTIIYFFKKMIGHFAVVLIFIAIEALIFKLFIIDKQTRNKYLKINFIILMILSALFIYLKIIKIWHYFE